MQLIFTYNLKPQSDPQLLINLIKQWNPFFSSCINCIVLLGPASVVCAETLRQEGFDGKIILCSMEQTLPYDRPKLSKVVMWPCHVTDISSSSSGNECYSWWDKVTLRSFLQRTQYWATVWQGGLKHSNSLKEFFIRLLESTLKARVFLFLMVVRWTMTVSY